MAAKRTRKKVKKTAVRGTRKPSQGRRPLGLEERQLRQRGMAARQDRRWLFSGSGGPLPK